MEHYGKHSMFIPKGTGISPDELSDEDLRKLPFELTAFERACPHAEFYDLMPAPLPEEHREAIENGPMDSRYAFSMQDYGKFMNNTGHCDVENGYCVLPDGVTYASALIRQEGRTDEVIDFYNQYFAPEDSLFYKTWYPGSHYLHFEGGCLEDFGFGRMKLIFAEKIKPCHLGIKEEEIVKNDPACIFIGGTSAVGYNLDGKDPKRPERNVIALYHRLTDYGREVRIRLWYGIGVEKGQYYKTLLDSGEALDIAKKTMIHIMQEYTNDQYLETAFFNKFHNQG